jgi:hypothetical protein
VGSSSFGRRRGRPGLISTSSRPFLSFAFAAVQVTHFPFGFKMLFFFFFFFCVDARVPENRRSWKAWLEGTSCLVDPVILHCCGADLSSYFGYSIVCIILFDL